MAFVDESISCCTDFAHNTIRINISYVSGEENVSGIQRLAEVIHEEIATHL
ncbi:MAG: hypothetical protein GXO83_06425 [Chlorobi bacterium]|nr:hypothetical protein [Chlorobiota bacterium]